MSLNRVKYCNYNLGLHSKNNNYLADAGQQWVDGGLESRDDTENIPPRVGARRFLMDQFDALD